MEHHIVSRPSSSGTASTVWGSIGATARRGMERRARTTMSPSSPASGSGSTGRAMSTLSARSANTERGAGIGGRERIGNDRERLVVDHDEVGGVLGGGA